MVGGPCLNFGFSVDEDENENENEFGIVNMEIADIIHGGCPLREHSFYFANLI